MLLYWRAEAAMPGNRGSYIGEQRIPYFRKEAATLENRAYYIEKQRVLY
jgi:hypothetical protein